MSRAEQRRWETMLARSFHPRQWFDEDGYLEAQEEAIMWVYREVNGVFLVGYYAPDGEWQHDSEFADREEAAARVNYLNGGKRK